MKTKVMTIVGTRPEIIKLSRIIYRLDNFTDHILVHTGQNYDFELNEIFFNDLGIRKPNYFLNAAGETTSETISKIIYESDKIIELEKPDALLLYGDTNSCLSVISAKRKQVPIFHMEAGNRCFDQRVPEEINRKIVDHLSDINMPLTEHARQYLILEGIKPNTIIKTGSCMKEILDFYSNKIEKSRVHQDLNLKLNKYFLVSAHREENVDYKENLESLLLSLNSIAEEYELPIIVSTHPRTKDRIEKINTKIKPNKLISFLKPLGFFDYIKLQKNAFCVISDSGTITEESSILKFPAITIRQSHERPEGMDKGTLIMSGLDQNRIIESINIVTNQYKNNIIPEIIDDYNVDNVSQKVVKIILSYIDYVNSTVWKKIPQQSQYNSIKLRILVISQYFYPENFRINDLCLGLKEQGHTVSVLTAKPNYPKGAFYEGFTFFNNSIDNYKGITVYRAPIIPRGNASGLRLFINYISFVFLGIVRLLFIKEKFDKVFVYAPSPITVGYIGIIASWKFRAQSYLWVHDLWPESVRDAGGINNRYILSLIDFMTRSIYSFYNKILIQSPYFKDYLLEQSVSQRKIIYYPYYAEEFYGVVDPKANIKSQYGEGLNLVFAGNIGVAQSFDTIVEAAKILKNKIDKFSFIIIGEGRDKKRIVNKISEYSLEKNFKFLGSYPPEKMSDFFACADALIVSLKDTKIFSLTIPGKLQSYLASGKPIIGSLSGIGAKIIEDSESGYVSNSEDVNELVNSIIKFNKLDESERKCLGQNARKYFEKEFERSKLLKRLINIFDK